MYSLAFKTFGGKYVLCQRRAHGRQRSDFVAEEEVFEIYTEKDDLGAVREALEGAGYTIESAEESMIPSNYVTLDNEDDIKKMNLLLEHLEDNDDVQEVFHNCENCD